MGDRGLGEAHALFDVAGAETFFLGRRSRCASLFESLQDAAPRGIGDGVQGVVERWGCVHRGVARRGEVCSAIAIAVKSTGVNMRRLSLARSRAGRQPRDAYQAFTF